MDLAIAQQMIEKKHKLSHNQFEKSISIKSRTNSNNRLLASNLASSQAVNELEEEVGNNASNNSETSGENNENKTSLIIKNLISKANRLLNEKVNKTMPTRPYTTLVKFYIVFLRLGEIDNVQERFEANAYIESYWEDEGIDGGKFDPSQHWHPEIFIENAVGNLKQEVKYRIERVNKRTRVYEMRRVKGFFWERLELQDFPLDDQDLSITITSARCRDEVQFELSDENECSINPEDFQQQQEWHLFTHMNTSKRFIYDRYKDYERPAYTISSKIARRPGYFINNAYMLIFFISILGFVPFSFASTSPHFRIQTTLLLILSSVNFRWIVTQRLPSISYLTILDKYAITALVFLVSLCVWHAIIGSSLFWNFTKAERDNIDYIALYIIASLFVGFHIVYILFFIWKYLRYEKISKSIQVANKENVESRAVSTSNVKPIVKSSAVNPTVLIPKYNEQINLNGEVKYRNLMESPSSSMSGDINAATPISHQKINYFEQKNGSSNNKDLKTC